MSPHTRATRGVAEALTPQTSTPLAEGLVRVSPHGTAWGAWHRPQTYAEKGPKNSQEGSVSFLSSRFSVPSAPGHGSLPPHREPFPRGSSEEPWARRPRPTPAVWAPSQVNAPFLELRRPPGVNHPVRPSCETQGPLARGVS